ncbi:hypothetical protein M407DRAFT_26447 [Tulasnella calospora MUT 4182]|uniref:Uncharacterized protein n=1 Tax=Tulasnella calospora MUT 4182 TaxID=1051891 RepID=A0A0C3KRU0_9AGAM|nr:hypothetical protein M407DRAFT_26447 [Tulasnella calospora MUT 4182]
MAAREILDQLDASWYSKLNPRWMDLLGVYVGNELFLIDGDTICQRALNDPLLALGKSQDCSFQLLHAVWNVEKLVSEFPMCVLCNDGSPFATVDCGDFTINAVLLQRHFIFTMLSNGIAVVSLDVTEFRGSKINSFVYEQNLLLKEQKELVELMIKCEENALQFLPKPQHQDPIGSSTNSSTEVIERWAQTAVDQYFQSNAPDATNDAVFTIFLLHLVVLPYLSISDRSQKPVTLHPKLESKLRNDVIPKLLDALNESLMKNGVMTSSP